MAFGGGALLAAVTLELAVESLERAGLAPLAFGFVAGAVLFMGLNRALNGHGGFLRKLSTTTRYLVETKRRAAAALLRRLARAPVIRALPPSEIQAVLPLATPFSYEAGTTIFEIGDPGDSMYVIEDGLVEIVHSEAEGALGSLGPGEIFGEMALVTGAARSATARAGSDVSGWSFHKRDFDRLLDASPKMREAVDEAFRERTANLRQRELVSSEVADAWTRDAEAFLEQARVPITNADVEQAQSTHGNASLAIWLGILLDGIPESLVIGATAVSRDGVSMTLIAGVFLANFPEALSSSVGMSRHGYSTKKILGMWTSLMILNRRRSRVRKPDRRAGLTDTLRDHRSDGGGRDARDDRRDDAPRSQRSRRTRDRPDDRARLPRGNLHQSPGTLVRVWWLPATRTTRRAPDGRSFGRGSR